MGPNGNLRRMPRRFEHRASFSAPARTVYTTLVDSAFLTERLRALGGKGAALVDHSSTGDQVVFRLRQGLDAQRLPGAVRAILKGDLVVEREERWQRDGDGYASTSRVTISGVPGEINGRARLGDRSDGGSELATTAEARVGIPLVGGKIEGLIADMLLKALKTENVVGRDYLSG